VKITGMNRPLALLACVPVLASCLHFEHNPKDRELADVPALSSGACDGPELASLDDLYSGPYALSPGRPDAGSTVAFEGRPEPMLICTELGCAWECCDNSCGTDPGCTYFLPVDDYNSLCLSSPDFDCGGTDCSPWCQPFSTSPRHDYRFTGTIRYDSMHATLDVASYCRVDG